MLATMTVMLCKRLSRLVSPVLSVFANVTNLTQSNDPHKQFGEEGKGREKRKGRGGRGIRPGSLGEGSPLSCNSAKVLKFQTMAYYLPLSQAQASIGGSLYLQEIAKSRPLDVKGQRGFKILILNEVDRMSREAQHSLRRTMEKYSSACRLVLACSNISKACTPLEHRLPCGACIRLCIWHICGV